MLSPLKQRIVTLLTVAGSNGMSGDDLFRIIYDGQLPRGGVRGPGDRPRKRSALKAHIQQLNKLLPDHKIVGERCPGGWYRLVKRSELSRRTASRPSPSR